MAKFCPKCGNPAEEGAAFCNQCGHKFDAFVPPPAQAYTVPPQRTAPAAGAGAKKKKKFPLIPAVVLVLAVVLVTGFLYPGWFEELPFFDSGGGGVSSILSIPVTKGDSIVKGDPTDLDISGRYEGTAVLKGNDGTVENYDDSEVNVVPIKILGVGDDDASVGRRFELDGIPLAYSAAADTWHGSGLDDDQDPVTVEAKFTKNPDGSLHLSGTMSFYFAGEDTPYATVTLDMDSASK